MENPCSLSPNSRPPNPIALDDFLPLNAKLATDQDDKHLVHFKQTNDSSQSDEEDDQKTPTEVVAPILPHNHANMFYGAEHAPLLQIKRSYSDSDLRDLKLVVQEEENEELANKQTSRNRLKRASTRYSKVCPLFFNRFLNTFILYILRPIIRAATHLMTTALETESKCKLNN